MIIIMKENYQTYTITFSRRYTSVILQQGRVILDSDWNEQADESTDVLAGKFKVILKTNIDNAREFKILRSVDKVNKILRMTNRKC